jgi:hypothetical protein
MDYNVWYQLDASCDLLYINGVHYQANDWSTYKSTTGFDAHSYIVNPKYSSTTVNLNIDSDSQAVNSGTNTGITTDYLGNSRVGNYDIGAYEYQPPGPSTTKVAATTGGRWIMSGNKVVVP